MLQSLPRKERKKKERENAGKRKAGQEISLEREELSKNNNMASVIYSRSIACKSYMSGILEEKTRQLKKIVE